MAMQPNCVTALTGFQVYEAHDGNRYVVIPPINPVRNETLDLLKVEFYLSVDFGDVWDAYVRKSMLARDLLRRYMREAILNSPDGRRVEQRIEGML